MEAGIDEVHQRDLREAIARLSTGAEPAEDPPSSDPVDVVISHAEVCAQHGTGIMTKEIFGGTPGLVSIRSRDVYGGHQDFGERALRFRPHSPTPGAALAALVNAFRADRVRRIVCIPFFADDVATAIALKAFSCAPLCTFLMDDNNIEASGISDGPLRELLSISDLRLAISNEMRDAYAEKFGFRFWVVPPLVSPVHVLLDPAVPPRQSLERRRGILVGSIYGPEWLARLRATLRGTGITVDWYCNAVNMHGASTSDLARDGIRARGSVPDAELVRVLRGAPWAIVPSGTLDPRDSRRAIARFSLPSRVTYVLATSHAPMVMLGHPDTAAARFVTSHAIGVCVPYDRDRFVSAVADLSVPSIQAAMRARAAALAPLFSAAGAREWIWRSLEAGRAVDDRWERPLSERNVAC